MQALPDNSRAHLRCCQKENGNPAAFTLVELLVSMAVLAILVLALGQVLSQVGNAWRSGEGNAERRRSARAIADIIAAELSGVALPVEPGVATTNGNLQFLINPSSTRMPTTYRNADAMFWQAPLATESSHGDMACVGYFVKWEGSVPMLCRLFINPTVMVDGAASANPLFKLYDTNPDAWLTPDVLDAVIAPADKNKGYQGLFAEYVLGLWVRSYGADGTELPASFDSRVGYDCTITSASGTYTEKRYLPAMIELSLAQIDSRHAHELSRCVDQVKAITGNTMIRDADGFMTALQTQASGSQAVAQLLPGVRIYTTSITLQNAR